MISFSSLVEDSTVILFSTKMDYELQWDPGIMAEGYSESPICFFRKDTYSYVAFFSGKMIVGEIKCMSGEFTTPKEEIVDQIIKDILEFVNGPTA